MSDDNESSNEGEGIKNLRSQYEATQRELTEARERLSKFEAEHRQQTVAEVLKAKGLEGAKAAKAAALYSGDDASEDAVGKWLESYADVFNIQPAGNDAQAGNVQRVSEASFGTTDTNQNGPTGRVLGSPDEIGRAIQTLPMEELVRLGYMPKPGERGARNR